MIAPTATAGQDHPTEDDTHDQRGRGTADLAAHFDTVRVAFIPAASWPMTLQ